MNTVVVRCIFVLGTCALHLLWVCGWLLLFIFIIFYYLFLFFIFIIFVIFYLWATEKVLLCHSWSPSVCGKTVAINRDDAIGWHE